MFQSFPFMDGDMVSLVALDEILGLFLRRMMYVSVDPHIRNNLLKNDAPDSAGLGIPFDVVTAFEGFCHGHFTLLVRTTQSSLISGDKEAPKQAGGDCGWLNRSTGDWRKSRMRTQDISMISPLLVEEFHSIIRI